MAIYMILAANLAIAYMGYKKAKQGERKGENGTAGFWALITALAVMGAITLIRIIWRSH